MYLDQTLAQRISSAKV